MKRWWAMAVLALWAGWAQAAEVGGVKLADSVEVGGQTLALNGAGVRNKWFFKVYVGALYLPQRSTDASSVLVATAPRRIALHMLRDLGSRKFNAAFSEGISANHSAAELAVLQPALEQMRAIFDRVQEAHAGDVVLIDYVPGSGTVISVNQNAQGTIPGLDFNRALMKIWLGNKPAQDDLKKALLGG